MELFTGIRLYIIKGEKPMNIEIDAEVVCLLTIGNAKTGIDIGMIPMPPDLTEKLIEPWANKFSCLDTLHKKL
jgi:hypothetical protein